MHDRLVPPGLFFSTACGASGGSHYRPIHAPKIVADVGGAQTLQNIVKRTVGIPLIEKIPHGSPLTELFRQVAPRRAGSLDPNYSINNITPISLWSSRSGRWWK